MIPRDPSQGDSPQREAMRPLFSSRTRNRIAGVLGPAWRLGFLLLPTALLLTTSIRQQEAGATNLMLWMGTGFQFFICALTLCSRRSWNQPVGASVVMLYLIGLAWLWLANPAGDWFTHLAKAILLVIPM